MSPVPEHRRGWVIEVCRTCDRVANWPFCEHRDQPPPPGASSWTVAVDVIPRRRSEQAGNIAKPPRPPRGPSGVSPGPDGTR